MHFISHDAVYRGAGRTPAGCWLADLLTQADTNHDGDLNAAEMKAFLAAHPEFKSALLQHVSPKIMKLLNKHPERCHLKSHEFTVLMFGLSYAVMPSTLHWFMLPVWC